MYIYYTQGHLLWFFFTFLRRLFRSAAAFNVLDIWMLRGIESSSLLYSILWLPPYYVVVWPKQFVFSWRCHLPCSPAGRWSINYGLEGCCKQQGSSDCISSLCRDRKRAEARHTAGASENGWEEALNKME